MYNNELYHHGIKGQRWGIRRYQNQDGSLTELGKKHKLNYTRHRFNTAKDAAMVYAPVVGVAGGVVASIVSGNPVIAQRTIIAAQAVIVGTGVLVAASRQLKDYIDRDYLNAKKNDGPLEKKSQMKRMKTPTTMAEVSDVKQVNPYTGRAGGVSNCTNCAIAIDMRCRGYDVRARRRGVGRTDSQIAALYKGGKFERPTKGRFEKKSTTDAYSKTDIQKAYYEFCNDIETKAPNSRGIVTLSYAQARSGHAFNYECKNGKVTFYDGQDKHLIDSSFILSNPNTLGYMRTDNLQPADNIGEAVVSRKEKK